jgi:alanine racemase
MGRLGVPYYEAKEFVQKLMQMGIYIEGIYTHLSCADTDEEFSFEQYQRFCHLLQTLEEEGIHIPVKHVANSAAALMWECMHMDMARCGITIYGLYPSSQLKQKVNLSPAMQFKCRIVFLKMLKEPFPISYGRTYTAPAGTLIATVPVGYANGLPRSLSNKAYMLVNGVRCPLVGNVCMDFSMLDVTAAKDVKVGDEVVIFGQQQTGFIGVEEVATWAGTISYEIVCRVGRNSSRLYTREKEDRVPQQFRRRSMT